MQKYVIAQAMEHEMKLRQLGGKVTLVSGKMCYVQFDVKGLVVSYVYNINHKGQFFLERIKPYPLPVKTFDQESEVIDIISIDLEQFRCAADSHNMLKFIELGKLFNETAKRFEDLFLYYNVPSDVIDGLEEELQKANKMIDECKVSAKRLYFKKEPDNL